MASSSMMLTKSLSIVLPSGQEYRYQMVDGSVDGDGNPIGDPEINSIALFPNNITVTFKNRGPMVWLLGNISAFSHDKELSILDEVKDTPTAETPLQGD